MSDPSGAIRVVGTEEWRPVVGWEGRYQVSDRGRVWSAGGPRASGARGIVMWPPRILKPSNSRYRSVTLMADGVKVTRLVHHLVAEAFLGPCPEGMQVCHRDGDAHNNTAANLEYGTASSNIADEVHHGTHRNSSKTHCPREHPLTDPNLVYSTTPKGSRTSQCRACVNARMTIKYRTGRAAGAHLRPEFKALADEQCDRILPGWRDWTPPDGFSRCRAS